MPVAAKALIVPTVTSAARAFKKVPGCNDSRREQTTDNLQESSVLWRGFTSDREGDDEYNMHMAKNLSTRSAKSQRAHLRTIMILLEHASTCNRKKVLRQLKMLRIGQKNAVDLSCVS